MHPQRTRSTATATFHAILRIAAAGGLAAVVAAQSPAPTTHWAFRPVERPPVPAATPGTAPTTNAAIPNQRMLAPGLIVSSASSASAIAHQV